jgi:hypothetical protein
MLYVYMYVCVYVLYIRIYMYVSYVYIHIYSRASVAPHVKVTIVVDLVKIFVFAVWGAICGVGSASFDSSSIYSVV